MHGLGVAEIIAGWLLSLLWVLLGVLKKRHIIQRYEFTRPLSMVYYHGRYTEFLSDQRNLLLTVQ